MAEQQYKTYSYEELLRLGLPPKLAFEALARKLLTSDLIGDYRSSFRGSGLDFAELREYQPGDDVSRIDWKVTARSGKPQVKLFHEERLLRIMLMVDVSASVLPGNPEPRLNQVLRFCAALSKLALGSKDQVGLASYSSDLLELIPASNRRSQFQILMQELSKNRDYQRETSLESSSQTLLRRYKKRCTYFVVSDFFDASAAEGLAQLAHRNDVVLVQVTNPIDYELPRAGLVQIKEAEGKGVLTIDTASKKARAFLKQHFEEHSKQSELLAKRLGLLHVELRDNVDSALQQLMRGKRRRFR